MLWELICVVMVGLFQLICYCCCGGFYGRFYMLWQLICVVMVGFIRPYLLQLHLFSGGCKNNPQWAMKFDQTPHSMTHAVLSKNLFSGFVFFIPLDFYLLQHTVRTTTTHAVQSHNFLFGLFRISWSLLFLVRAVLMMKHTVLTDDSFRNICLSLAQWQ